MLLSNLEKVAIKQGASIGANAMIGAGAIVTKNVLAGAIIKEIW